MKSIRKENLLLILLLSIVFLASCRKAPETVEVVQNYGTGEISRKYTTVDGKKEGLMIDYYPDGSLKGERWFKDDIQVGKTTLYHKSGGIKEVQYYSDGKIHGGDTLFYEDGKPEMLVTFTHGIKDGYVRKWGKDGSLVYEAKYQMDTLVEVKGEPVRHDSMQ